MAGYAIDFINFYQLLTPNIIFWKFVFALSESKMSDANYLHIVMMVSIIPLR
jgi:hypothetical protein